MIRALRNRLVAVILAVFALGACSSGSGGERASGSPRERGRVGSGVAGAATVTALDVAESPEPGNVERGEALVRVFQCNRCHDGTGLSAMATEQHCTHCHEDISTGRFGAGTPKIGEWKRSVAPYRYAPSLEAIGRRFRRDWVVAFLREPYDLRPHLPATMPRLAMSSEQAADLAAYLTRDAPPPASDVARGDLSAGRALMEQKGCGGCHVFTGVPPFPSTADPVRANDSLRKAIALAPDLKNARRRFRPDTLASWLVDPKSVKPDTEMPSHGLSLAEARDIGEYVLHVPLDEPAKEIAPARLPLLSRPVSYGEVEQRVFSVTCRHCHGDADAAGGDGGPGNTGGFGFAPRRLDLSDYRGTNAGFIGDDHERHSIFEKGSDGVPVLVRALLARQSEEAGDPPKAARGMPLGLPAVSAEDIALVATWIAQGRPR